MAAMAETEVTVTVPDAGGKSPPPPPAASATDLGTELLVQQLTELRRAVESQQDEIRYLREQVNSGYSTEGYARKEDVDDIAAELAGLDAFLAEYLNESETPVEEVVEPPPPEPVPEIPIKAPKKPGSWDYFSNRGSE